ncbi:MAG: glycosyltransferase family 9 protein [Pirellulales bacterium]
MSAAPRILIVKLTAIGDVVHAMPVACALRERFPQAYIAWLAEGRAGDLLAGHRAIDRRIVAPRRWLKSPSAVWNLRRQLRGLQFDVSIDLQGLTKSAVAAWLSGARRRIGFGGEMGREISRLFNRDRVVPTSPHVVDRYLELLAPLGIEKPTVRFDVPHFAAAATSVERFLAQRRLVGSLAVINPGAGWPSKRWPADRLGLVARHLGARHGLPSVVVWAGDDERRWAEEIVSLSSGHAHLAPATSLAELAELTRRACLFVGADTGPLHLAAAVATPCVGLFGPMPADRNGPYGPQHIAIQKAVLNGTSRQRRTADNATMLAISVEDVVAACDTILARRERKVIRA